MKRAFIWSLLISIGWPCSLAWTADDHGKDAFNMDLKPDAAKVVKALSGPARSAADFKNHVVVLAFWDAQTPATLALLAGWQKQYAEQGLIVIASEAKGAKEDEVKKVAADKGFSGTVTSGSAVDGAEEIKEVPHVIVFDSTGQCVYRGSPTAAETKLRAAIAAAPAPALAGVELKKLANLAAALKHESPAAVLKQAQAQTGSPDTATADEAKLIVDTLTAYGKKEVDRAKALTDTDLVSGLTELKNLSAAWQGTEVGKSADEILGGLKKEQAALAPLGKVRNLESRLIVKDAAGTDMDPGSTAFKTKNNAYLGQMRMLIREISKQCAGTKAAAEAVQIAARYHIDLSSTMDYGNNNGNGYPNGGYPSGGYPSGGGKH